MKPRFPHIIKDNAANEFPSRIVFFDTETKEIPRGDETELVLHLGEMCLWDVDADSEAWYSFTNIKTFWSFVQLNVRPKTKLYMVAHNVAFDFRILKGFDYFKDEGWTMKKFIYNGTSNIWEFRKDESTVCILDNMNFFKSSLKVLGKSIGIEKMEMPINDDSAMFIYCKRDVEIMIAAWRKLFRFLHENDLGNFSKTIASQAFAAYRHRFMKTPIHIHTNEYAIGMERASYHGGRTEAYYIGNAPKQEYFMLDVNSMYPSVMKENEYPVQISRIYKNISMQTAKMYLRAFAMTARCLVKTDEPVFPVKQDAKLIFPTGIFETVLTTREIEYAIKNNMLRKIYSAVLYQKGNIFSEYVDYFYNLRLKYKNENDESFSYLCKLFLNSLYGKFGQRNEQYAKIGNNPNTPNGLFRYFDMKKDSYVTERRMNGIIEESIGVIEGHDSFVAIAAHITADARMKLWGLIKECRMRNIFYCDTDSLIVNSIGYKRLAKYIGFHLGQLSIKEQSDILSIHGAKDYTFGCETVLKGIRKDALQIDDSTYEQVRFEGIAGAMRNMRTDKMIISNVRKHLSRNYDKGTILKNGRVVPFRIYGTPPML